MDVAVSGIVAPGFEVVKAAFEENFISRGELGAQVSIFYRGELVVDLVGGLKSSTKSSPFTSDTLVNVYSVGKAILGLLALQQIDQGAIALDEPLANFWPEFAAFGKQETTVRMALCHQAGVPAIDQLLTNNDLEDWDTMASALANTKPWHEPGTAHLYHTNTYGHLIGEIVRRTSGRGVELVLGDAMKDLGAEIYVGLADALIERCADIEFTSPLDPRTLQLGERTDESSMALRSYFNPPGYSSMGLVNTTRWRRCVVPSTNMHATAKGVATFYKALLQPNLLLSSQLLAEATSVQSEGFCPILGEVATFGLGFTPTTSRRPLGPNPNSFGHFGTGGALGFCDPTAQIAFGYVMNQVTPRWQSTRNAALRTATYAAVDALEHRSLI
jgi:CubicO group peptidase (beta-lactamase class C family)